MTLRMDHVTIVVEDMPAAVAFFTALGMAVEGSVPVKGSAVDRLCGLKGVEADITMMRTLDGHGRIELTKYRSPQLVKSEPAAAPPNTFGLRQIMFAVDDIEGTMTRLRPHGAQLIGEVVRYEEAYKLCYLRGPAGIIIALAEKL